MCVNKIRDKFIPRERNQIRNKEKNLAIFREMNIYEMLYYIVIL